MDGNPQKTGLIRLACSEVLYWCKWNILITETKTIKAFSNDIVKLQY